MESKRSSLQRLFSLISFLSSDYKSVKEMVAYLGEKASKSSVYRDLEILKQEGFYLSTQNHKYKILDKKELKSISNDVVEGVTDKTKTEELYQILSSPFFKKKPFIEVLYGEYNEVNASKFSYKLHRIRESEGFDIQEVKKIREVLKSIMTHLEMYLY